MEETGKKRLIAFLVVLAGIAYFLVCAIPLPKELVLSPSWSTLLPAEGLAGASPSAAPARAAKDPPTAGTPLPSGAAIPFRLGASFGYFAGSGELILAAVPAYGVALSPEAYALYDKLSSGFTISSPSGAAVAKVEALGYPFFAASRRFVIGPDQAEVSELAADGKIAWTRRFGSIATAFSASPSLAVFGLLDGSIVGIDPAGKEVLNFAPGGSRIAGIYGVAVSPDGGLVAAISGLDRQRLVVMEKRVSAYRVAYHRWLDSEYRRPVDMAFTEEGGRLVFESAEGARVYEPSGRGGGREVALGVPSPSGLGQAVRRGGLLVLVSGSGGGKRLVCASASGRIVIDAPFAAADAFVRASGDAIFLGADDRIARLDLKEL